MTGIVLAISAAYVVIGVLLLTWACLAVPLVDQGGGHRGDLAFFIEVFFSTKSLLGWPGTGQLPPRFQLLWTRVVEPDPKISDPGAIYLWVEELDENNVPSGTPRSFRLPYTPPLADKLAQGARRDHGRQSPGRHRRAIMESDDDRADTQEHAEQLNGPNRNEFGSANIDLDMLIEQAQQVEFKPLSGPLLPAKN